MCRRARAQPIRNRDRPFAVESPFYGSTKMHSSRSRSDKRTRERENNRLQLADCGQFCRVVVMTERFSDQGNLRGFGFQTGHYSFTWSVTGFSNLDSKRGSQISSQDFWDHDTQVKCYMAVFPGGRRSSSNGGFVSCMLCFNDSPATGISLKFSLSLLTSDGDVICRHHEDWHVCHALAAQGAEEMIERKALLERLTDDVLVVSVVLEYSVSTVFSGSSKFEAPVNNGLLRLANDFGKLLETQIGSDFVIRVGETDIPVHKTVLAARCKVFAAMFDHGDTTEGVSNRLELADFEEDVVRAFLNFLYTGNLEYVDMTLCLELLRASEKYDIEDLKKFCSNYLVSCLNDSTVCKILVYADLNNANELRRRAIEYFCENKASIDFTKYQYLLEQRPSILSDIIKLLNYSA